MGKAKKKEKRTYKIGDLPHKRSPEHLSFYANNSMTSHTPFDLEIVFGNIEFLEGKSPFIKDEVSIRLTPVAALGLANAIIVHMKENEGEFARFQMEPVENPETEPETKST